MSKNHSQRLKIINETKLKCIDLDLMDDIATKILFVMLDNYQKDGTTYVGKELNMSRRYNDMQRKYVINLWNDQGKKDTVLISALNDEEAIDLSLVKRQRKVEKQTRSVVDGWVRDELSSDDKAPDLV